MLSIIDNHCHLDFEEFNSDREAILKNAFEHGVYAIVVPGVKKNSWPEIKNLCAKANNIFPCYGIHPYEVDNHESNDLAELEHWLKNENPVALGECGLDYRDTMPDIKTQQAFFTEQLKLACTLDLPVVIHSVRATEDVIKFLKTAGNNKGMVHSYSGSYEQAKQLIDMGFYISFGGNITYERANRLRNVAKRIPLDALLIETDSPDQPDSKHTGERNEPAYLVNVLECLAELRDESKELIASKTTENACKLFNLTSLPACNLPDDDASVQDS